MKKSGIPFGLLQKRFQVALRQEQYNLRFYTDYIFPLTAGISSTALFPLCVSSVKLMWEL